MSKTHKQILCDALNQIGIKYHEDKWGSVVIDDKHVIGAIWNGSTPEIDFRFGMENGEFKTIETSEE